MFVFLIFIFLILFGMHYYVLAKILGFFVNTNKIWLYALILAAMYPLASIIDRTSHSGATIALYYAASVWIGIVFLAFFTILIFEAINIVYPVFDRLIFAGIIIGIIVLVTIISVASAAQIKVKEVQIDNFGKDMTVVQLSDVHIGTIKNTAFLNRVVKKTNSLNPDIVVITGDLLDGSGKLNLDVLEPLNEINAPVYMIMGNHEFYEGEDRVIKLLNKTNVTVLRNDSVTVKGIEIIGLDYSENKTYVSKELEKIKINDSKPSILLNHVPIGYIDAKNAGIDLQLSGHTHAGQIFPFTLLVRAAFPKYRGLYTFEDSNFALYVSQGTGTWGPPMRLGSTGEITLLHLKK
jgi:predicted MPP superfamily phosphohydrolase